MYFYVLGHQQTPFGWAWFLSADERLRYWVVIKRMLAWFVSGAVFGTVWGLVLDAIGVGR
jgi:hypothetical protein